MKVCIKDVVDFYAKHPECIGNVEVKTRFGYKTVEAAQCTAKNSEVICVKTDSGNFVKTSPDHLMLSNDAKWVKVKDLEVNDWLFTESDATQITSIKKLKTKQDLYDLQVADVKEFYANGLVSHNSTMLDALTFALYGRAYRNINKPSLVNSITNKGLLVELEFKANNKQMLVRRGIKPTVFEVYQDGKLLNQDSASRDYQEMLETNILKINFKSFRQIVVLGLANHTPFMLLPANQRREVIEDLLDIQIFSVMNSLLKERVQGNKQAIQDNEYKLKLVKSKIELDKKRIADLQKLNTDIIKEKQEKIYQYKKENEEFLKQQQELMIKINDHSKKLVDFEKFQDKFSQLKDLRQKLEKQKIRLNKDISFYKDSESCPTCKQEIGNEFRLETIEKRNETLEQIAKGLDHVEVNIQSLTISLNEMNEQSQALNSLLNTHKSIGVDINTNLQFITNAEDEIASIKERSQEFKDAKMQQSLLDEHDEICKQRDQLLKDREVFSIATQLLKDGGIKTKIIRQYVPIINKLINKYLAAFDFFCQFEIDENFEETIKSRGRDFFSYENFSQGERLRIDLALMFSWRMVSKLRNSTNSNLLILDEILDSSLDAAGVEDFLKILKKLPHEQNTFIISHKTDAILEQFDNVLRFEKVKNFSRVVESGN